MYTSKSDGNDHPWVWLWPPGFLITFMTIGCDNTSSALSQKFTLSCVVSVFAITGKGIKLYTADLPDGGGGDQGQIPEVALLLCSRSHSSEYQSGCTVALAVACRCHRRMWVFHPL